MFPDATLLALSATCTIAIRKKVMKVVGLTGDTVEICLSPNKTNIKLVACKIPNELEMAMSWLVDSLQEYRVKFTNNCVFHIN